MKHKSTFTYLFILLNIVVAVIGIFQIESLSTQSPMVFINGTGVKLLKGFGLIPINVKNGEWWRLITSMFIHSGLIHLFSNMAVLFYCGRLLEGRIGSFKMLLIYVIGGLCGGLLVMFLSQPSEIMSKLPVQVVNVIAGSPYSITVGASGAIFSVMGATYVLLKKARVSGATTAIGQNILINLVLTFIVPSISIGGHVGGLLTGLILGLFLCK